VTRLQIGVGVGTRACAFVVCMHLYKITRSRASFDTTKDQRRKAMIYELLLIIGLPFLNMALSIIIQPTRFDIIEELGCSPTAYSYMGYIIYYAPPFVFSLGCAILAPLTLRTFLRHRKEMNEFLSSGQDITHNKYNRLMVIACLDTFVNLPVLITMIVTEILRGKESLLNYPYINWKNVHDGAGGVLSGLSLGSIEQTPVSEWNTDAWFLFNVKWDEWLYVLHAVMFFAVFGTTPETRQYYRTAFWFIPQRLGYKGRRVSEVETVLDVEFNSNPGLHAGNHRATNRRRGSLSFLETTVDTSASRSEAPGMVESNDLESGVTTTGTHRSIRAVAFVDGDDSEGAGGT